MFITHFPLVAPDYTFSIPIGVRIQKRRGRERSRNEFYTKNSSKKLFISDILY